MLITIEGPSCSGKSTLSHALQSRLGEAKIVGRPSDIPSEGQNVVTHPELSFEYLIIERSNSGLAELQQQIKFAHIVSRRLRAIQSHQHSASTVIADRDISSFYAHARARLYANGASYLTLFGELFRYVWSQTPVVPDLFVFIKTPRETCIKRAKIRDEKPMADIFDPPYFSMLSEGYSHMLLARGENYSIQLDGELSSDRLVDQILTAVERVRNAPKIDPRELINRLVRSLDPSFSEEGRR